MNGKSKYYSLRKWYVDFLTPEQDYFFLYFACVQFLGRTMRSLTIHLARPDKGITCTKSFSFDCHSEDSEDQSGTCIRIPGGVIVIGEESCNLDYSHERCSVRLRYVAPQKMSAQPVVIKARGRGNIVWRPIGLRYRVEGSLTIDGHSLAVKGSNGYADFLESFCLPPFVPVRKLYWGRLHHQNVDLVYMSAAANNGDPSWSKLYWGDGRRLVECEQLSIEDGQTYSRIDSSLGCPDTYRVKGDFDFGQIEIDIHHLKPVQQGGFLEQQEIRSSVARSALKILTRNPQSLKFLSHANIALTTGRTHTVASRIPMIDEYAIL